MLILLIFLKFQMTVFFQVLVLITILSQSFFCCLATQILEDDNETGGPILIDKIEFSQLSLEELIKHAADNSQEAQDLLLEKVKSQSLVKEQFKTVKFLKWHEKDHSYLVHPVYLYALLKFEDRATVEQILFTDGDDSLFCEKNINKFKDSSDYSWYFLVLGIL